jgi:hypothetical protein
LEKLLFLSLLLHFYNMFLTYSQLTPELLFSLINIS